MAAGGGAAEAVTKEEGAMVEDTAGVGAVAVEEAGAAGLPLGSHQPWLHASSSCPRDAIC